jgi:hypothetical protein
MGIKTADGKQHFKTCIFLKLKIKFSQQYIANIIGVVCNLQIPHAICSKTPGIHKLLIGIVPVA